MPKKPKTPNKSASRPVRPAVVAEAAPALALSTKGSINLRIDAAIRQLIDDAASILGKTRTEFMIESARRQAMDVLLEQRLFTLESEEYDALLDVLDNPPPPGPKLRALARRPIPWEQ